VLLAGHVPDATLAALYGAARALVHVPLAEGFGLPVVEAMAAGTPVIASPLPANGGAALEVDPLDCDAIAAAIGTLLGDDALRGRLVAAGHRRAGSLTWRATAAAHVALWDAIAPRR
jgi:alpha-1,3-rhamnosyl/mannosyltransferase